MYGVEGGNAPSQNLDKIFIKNKQNSFSFTAENAETRRDQTRIIYLALRRIGFFLPSSIIPLMNSIFYVLAGSRGDEKNVHIFPDPPPPHKHTKEREEYEKNYFASKKNQKGKYLYFQILILYPPENIFITASAS